MYWYEPSGCNRMKSWTFHHSTQWLLTSQDFLSIHKILTLAHLLLLVLVLLVRRLSTLI